MLQFTVRESEESIKGWDIRISKAEKPCTVSKDFVNQLGNIVEAAKKEDQLIYLNIWLPTSTTKTGKISLGGGDLDEMAKLQKKPKEQMSFFKRVKQMLLDIAQLDCLTSICFDGDVIGGGVELISAFDLRWTTEDSRIWCPQLFNGLCSGFGGESFLREKFGHGLAQYLLLSGSKILPDDLPPHFFMASDSRSIEELENTVNKYILRLHDVSIDALHWQKQSLRENQDITPNVLQNPEYEKFLARWTARK